MKKCEKCGESVEEAKAFCPECGNPFVTEQKRVSSSEFDKFAGTMKVTNSAYNMMLAEMELNTSGEGNSDQEDPLQKTPENVPKETESRQNDLMGSGPMTTDSAGHILSGNLQSSKKPIWIVVAVLLGIFLLILAIASIATLYFFI